VSTDAVRALADAGEVTYLEIAGQEGSFCALTETLDKVTSQLVNSKHVHILSPFDNLVIRRGWLAQFFGFAYKLEAYTPAAKRKYGYFCLPILWGERFVGRMDAKADRKSKTFIVRKLIFEPEFDDFEALWPGFVEKLSALATFSGCGQIAVEGTDPKVIQPLLERALALGGQDN
jgi:uncharacterized protein YcaQ